MLDEALGYLARGWSVVPAHTAAEDGLCSCRQRDCTAPGKHPRVRWKDYQTRLATEAELRRWWQQWPDANVIVLTGKLSGLLVIDVDPRHGGDEAWRGWVRGHPVAPTPQSLTGGGGTHVWFCYPPEQEITIGTNVLPGVDWRGEGGYVIAPPSAHMSGRAYEWDATAHPDDLALAEVPPALVMALLRKRMAPDEAEGGERRAIDVEGIIAGRVRIADGERNVEVARVAGAFAGSVSAYSELKLLVGAANIKACDPPLDEREVETICRSIWRREGSQRKVAAEEAERVELQSLEGLEGDQTLTLATLLWSSLGVTAVTDWYQMLGERVEYVLVTPEDEVRFRDLLDHKELRRTLLDHLGVLPPNVRYGSFDKKAKLLRDCARVVIVEPLKADELIEEWLGEYQRRFTARDGTGMEQPERDQAIQQGPLLDNEGRTVFRPSRLSVFVETAFGERMPTPELRRVLSRAGYEQTRFVRGGWVKVAPEMPLRPTLPVPPTMSAEEYRQ